MIKENTVHHGDSVAFLRTLLDASVDLIIADPPYSLDKDRQFGEGAFFESRDEWLAWCKEWLIQAKRILKPTGNLFVYAIHHNACFLQAYLYELELQYRRQIIWYYENGWSNYRNAPACHYEPILWFAHRSDSTFHTIREPYKSEDRLRHAITKKGKVWTPHPDGRQAGDVWKFPTLAGRRFADERTAHPTQETAVSVSADRRTLLKCRGAGCSALRWIRFRVCRRHPKQSTLCRRRDQRRLRGYCAQACL